MEFNACYDKSIPTFLTCMFCVLIDDEVKVWVEPQNSVLGHFQAEGAV